MFACGFNSSGQLGMGDNSSRSSFTAVPALPGGKVAKQVIPGSSHTMILAEDGTVFACGRNSYGQLGLGDTAIRFNFTAVPALPDGKVAEQVVSGGDHTMILAEDGTVFACGWNHYGQLGQGDTTSRSSFRPVPALPDGVVIKQLIAGSGHTIILAEDGTVFACGWNPSGQLGLGDTTSRNTFTAVPPLPGGKTPKQIWTGDMHTMVLATDGALFACGENGYGQLGLGDITNRHSFTAVPALPGGKVARQVVGGHSHTIVMAADGSVFGCGYNGHGRLGLGDTADRNGFTAVPALPGGKVAKQVLGGRSHAMILAQDGTVFACGRNGHGRLGLGDEANRHTFTAVPFFGHDHPGLVPSISNMSYCTFAFAAPAPSEEESFVASSNSLLQADLMALVGGDDVLHCDVTLVGSDGVSVEAHRALLYVRCPKLFQKQHPQHQHQEHSKRQRLSPNGVASPMLSPMAKAGGDDSAAAATITMSEVTGRALRGIVRFLYSDTLPDFDDESSTSVVDEWSSGLDAAFELMVAARLLSCPDAPAMQHLQALCERYIAKRLDLSNVVPLLAQAVEARCRPLQRACHQFLAERKPVTKDAAFAPKLLAGLAGNQHALATAFSAAGGVLSVRADLRLRADGDPRISPARRHGESLAPRRRRRSADGPTRQQQQQQQQQQQ